MPCPAGPKDVVTRKNDKMNAVRQVDGITISATLPFPFQSPKERDRTPCLKTEST